MKLITQIYLTVSAISIIFMSKYLINYSDVTVMALENSINKKFSLSTDKVQFHHKVYGLEDGLLSSTAVEDTTLTMGALYYQYTPVIAKNIYINKINIRFPLNKNSLDKKLSLDTATQYTPQLFVAQLIYNKKPVATVSYNSKGEINKITCTDFSMKIDTIGVGSTIGEAFTRWGQPTLSKGYNLHFYVLEEGITIGIINDQFGNITSISCGVTDKMNEERYGLWQVLL